MKIGLYFGSFNPIHHGHLILANYMIEYTDLDQLWFVVSPQNPFKNKKSLLADHYRYDLINLAVEQSDKLRVTNVEFNMPKPSYTIDTLTYLQEKHTRHNFVILMGEDGLPTFKRWKNYKQILNNHEVFVYPRPGYDGGEMKKHPKITMVNAPVIEISSSFIRQAIKERKDVRYFVPAKVWGHIEKKGFYE